MRRLQRPGFLMRLAETWFHRPAAPTRVVIDLTRRCNLRCTMCKTWAAHPGHELTPAELRRILGQMPRLNWLDLTGGELFLRRDAIELIEAACAAPSLGVLHFPTNGWFGDRILKAAERVGELRPDLDLLITVSLDGPPALHDRIRGQDGSFARAMDTFLRLRARSYGVCCWEPQNHCARSRGVVFEEQGGRSCPKTIATNAHIRVATAHQQRGASIVERIARGRLSILLSPVIVGIRSVLQQKQPGQRSSFCQASLCGLHRDASGCLNGRCGFYFVL